MAHISGGLLAVYMGFGADPVSILATCVMAAPCGLYLSKLFMPETEMPETRGVIKANPEQPHRNVIDAASAGASDGMSLAINVAAMLIAFLAILAMIDYLLGRFPTGDSLKELLSPEQGWYMLGNWLLTLFGYFLLCWCLGQLRQQVKFLNVFSLKNKHLLLQAVIYLAGYGLFLLALHGCMMATTEKLSLKLIFSYLFAPLAFLMGVGPKDVGGMANLLGTKLALNEFVAYQEFKTEYFDTFKKRSKILATYALTGFANFSSIGIQLGGIGGMAPNRRPDLARFGLRALFVGFLATILNACVAGILLEDD
jgi:concentrative nucleoside transporter, CNT family